MTCASIPRATSQRASQKPLKNWILSITAQDEYQLKLQAQGGGSDTTIHITGGLPPLPGTNINMAKEPSLNGCDLPGFFGPRLA